MAGSSLWNGCEHASGNLQQERHGALAQLRQQGEGHFRVFSRCALNHRGAQSEKLGVGDRLDVGGKLKRPVEQRCNAQESSRPTIACGHRAAVRRGNEDAGQTGEDHLAVGCGLPFSMERRARRHSKSSRIRQDLGANLIPKRRQMGSVQGTGHRGVRGVIEIGPFHETPSEPLAGGAAWIRNRLPRVGQAGPGAPPTAAEPPQPDWPDEESEPEAHVCRAERDSGRPGLPSVPRPNPDRTIIRERKRARVRQVRPSAARGKRSISHDM
jgi:hypothetical protein